MKKLLGTLLALLLCSMCPLAAAAEEAWATDVQVDSAQAIPDESYAISDTEELLMEWAKFAPDYICGIWSTDGTLERITIGIQNTAEGNSAKLEILDRIEDDSAVTFVYQKHSKNRLIGILDELYPYFDDDAGLVSAGLNEIDNRIDVAFFEERAEDPRTKELIRKLGETYGDAISISYTDAEFILTGGAAEIGAVQPRNYLPLYLAAGGMLILIGCGAVLLHRGRQQSVVMQTNTGTMAASSLSDRELAERIRYSQPSYPEELDAKILDAVRNEE